MKSVFHDSPGMLAPFNFKIHLCIFEGKNITSYISIQ